MSDFVEFPKIARLRRDITITEKIDGTNAAVVINYAPHLGTWRQGVRKGDGVVVYIDDESWLMHAQSRSRIITPEDDNFGFAAWVYENASELKKLGPGAHFGEWWGAGIQRGYGLQKGDRRFSLFNTHRWSDGRVRPECCDVVPVLYDGVMTDEAIETALDDLRMDGSYAAPTFDRPEGVVIYHQAAKTLFKITLENDDKPKG